MARKESSSSPVYVIVPVRWEVNIAHDRDVMHVNPVREDIGGDENTRKLAAKILNIKNIFQVYVHYIYTSIHTYIHTHTYVHTCIN